MEIKLENFYKIVDKKIVFVKNAYYTKYTLDKNLLYDYSCSTKALLYKTIVYSFYLTDSNNEILTHTWIDCIKKYDYIYIEGYDHYAKYVTKLYHKELWWNFLSSLKDNEIDENLMDFINSVLCY